MEGRGEREETEGRIEERGEERRCLLEEHAARATAPGLCARAGPGLSGHRHAGAARRHRRFGRQRGRRGL